MIRALRHTPFAALCAAALLVACSSGEKKADAKVDMLAEKEAKAAERAAHVADERAERDAAHAAGPVAQKKERGRSENLDPEIEA